MCVQKWITHPLETKGNTQGQSCSIVDDPGIDKTGCKAFKHPESTTGQWWWLKVELEQTEASTSKVLQTLLQKADNWLVTWSSWPGRWSRQVDEPRWWPQLWEQMCVSVCVQRTNCGWSWFNSTKAAHFTKLNILLKKIKLYFNLQNLAC